MAARSPEIGGENGEVLDGVGFNADAIGAPEKIRPKKKPRISGAFSWV